jgi:hypothetical protein
LEQLLHHVRVELGSASEMRGVVVRISLFGAMIGSWLACATLGWAQPSPPTPTTYEIFINGESFRVEANRQVTLESKTSPGTQYKVALRVAPTQPLRLNSLQLEYPFPAKVTDDRNADVRTVELAYETGFSITIRDLGQVLDAKEAEKMLKMHTDAIQSTTKVQKAKDFSASEPVSRKYANATALRTTVQYKLANPKDPEGEDEEHVVLVCVLTGSNFSATLVIDCLKKNAAEVGPMVMDMLNSVQALPGPPS